MPAPVVPPSEAHVVEAGGVRQAYHAWRPEGAPRASILALHGYGVTGYRTFRHAAAPLVRQRLALYAPDLLGFGHTEKPDGGYSLARYAGLAVALADEVGLDRPILLGHSLGGKYAAATAALHPEAFRALVLVNSGGFSPIDPLQPYVLSLRPVQWLMRQPLFLDGVLRRTPLGIALADDDELDYFRRIRRDHFALDLRHAGLWHRLKSLDLPVLILWGADDPILPHFVARRAARLFPRSTLTFIPDAGHAPMKDQPERFAEAVAAFVARMEG